MPTLAVLSDSSLDRDSWITLEKARNIFAAGKGFYIYVKGVLNPNLLKAKNIFRMEDIRKKMESLRSETQNALNRAEQLEMEAKEANSQADKTEDLV